VLAPRAPSARARARARVSVRTRTRARAFAATASATAAALLLVVPVLPAPAAARYAVGTADVTLFDPDRGDRPVPADLYYPAVAEGAGQPPAEPPAGGFAAAAVGHGYLMSAGVYAWLARELAAAGCVVAVARTGGELFPDHEEFGLDLAFLTRALRAAGDDPDSPFAGRMGGRALMAGHSMGGGASLLGAASDPTVTAVVGLAAAETDPSAIAACAALMRPVLIFAGTNDCVTPPEDHQIPMYDALAGGWRTLVTLAGASHCQFAAYSFTCSLGEFCEADISRELQQDRTWTLLGPWLRAVLWDAAQAAATFQERLDTTEGVAYAQAGLPTAAPDGLADPGAAAGDGAGGAAGDHGGLAAALLRGVQAAPNPFNPRTVIRFELAAASPVAVRIYDLRGRRLATLADGPRPAGVHRIAWDGRDHRGAAVSSGTYLYAVEAGRHAARGRVTLLE